MAEHLSNMSAKEKALALYLKQDDTALTSADETPWGGEPPDSPLRFKPPLTYGQLESQIEIQSREFPADNSAERVIRSLAMYAGVSPVGEAARHFTVHRGLSPKIIHPSVHMNLAGRSAKIRAVPSDWQDDESVCTPIIATQSERNKTVDLWFEGPGKDRQHLYRADVLAPATPTPLVYKTGEIMVINPQMVCPLECAFCIHKHLGTRDFGLVNFSPGETADYLKRQVSNNEDWQKLPMVKIITGAFRNYDHLLTYTKGFVSSMRQITNGAFDPINNEGQTIHLLTNLVQTEAEMRQLRAEGVGSLEHSLEIIDDNKRRQQMYRATKNGKVPGKGEQSFEQLVEAAHMGVQTYGPNHYAIGLVMGLDDLETTTSGLGQMYEAGVRQLTGGIFVPNAYYEIALQQMSFEQIMRARRFAARLFSLPNIFADYKK